MEPTIKEINLLSGQFTSPFLDYLCSFTDTPVSVTTLYTILQVMHHHKLNQEVFAMLQLLSDMMGYPFFIENAALNFDDAAAACFVNEVLADMKEYMQDIEF